MICTLGRALVVPANASVFLYVCLFPEGIVFSVRPPKKSWKNISNLSGGEKVWRSTPTNAIRHALACLSLLPHLATLSFKHEDQWSI